ncbi:MAG: ABC transporter, ATPase subunit [Candidatus Falkowbacteria bacterium GW2011_GWC2_38_22]|uniref:ABC transporter, ATPase subunit n=1 Tax=Candidatus Falkowbacteria bacterium GW2011_GWE1_38_31 TaxID=1618638 RepID=A0A0G0JVA6_9BACT|nr:MAG: ABC transporter, ATPase subunit [Candidatus Falkowbacteria bacterium GW2011_GWF2_38_1205]KKQ61696.1 MAG: ABC transporter, ATPase subunit [Candidatus Falkowbacteria bacterium GW2011_GWC2_38_22]KKQ63689.1 MAG: ABC transporter, ATPase subunit [Candidatus Falkowbacteria bacterium GW2011_GWF1_38_22]KKQ65895.1 MAG: ABC transporter, ATPase subunit [Candidatus Falkowbacteria bacterium GW2011_GWE2_38_254]KKQ70552.1 MAG: ABC transporter, ATPase subunit [Candidatus Falkowbacteria bacterium GW2011_
MIKVNKVKKTYEGKVPTYALKEVSFEIAEGKFVALMGRSGSGKSTLLHQLGLIDTPTSGKIYINNTEVTALSDIKKTFFRLKHLGYVFQEYALIAEFTALENVHLPARAIGNKINEGRAKELLELVGLGNRLSHYPSEMSGGEQQRVAIARSLINSPKVLFADEPTANLDTVSSETVLKLFQKLNRELKQTIIMVTHEPDDVKYVDQIIWLKDGGLEKIENNNKVELLK